MAEDCVFCKIISGKLPASFVYRDNQCSAFMDIHPINEGHLLIVPNKHIESVTSLTPAEASVLFLCAQRVYSAIKKSGLKCDGANFLLSDGSAAGQEVGHTHLHVVPRFIGDGQKIGFKHASQISQPSLDGIANKIRGQLTKDQTL